MSSSSCSKSEAEVFCLNGGIPLNGSCNCPTPYFGAICEFQCCHGTKTCDIYRVVNKIHNPYCDCYTGWTGLQCNANETNLINMTAIAGPDNQAIILEIE